MRDVLIWVLTLAFGFAISLSIFQHINKKNSIEEGNYSRYFKNLDEDIIIVSVDWCKYCDELKVLLKENRVKFYNFDPSKELNNSNIFHELNSDVFPIIVTNNIKIKGYSKQLIQDLPEFQNATN
ncbi:hypothetical protein [Colwellia sp. BRX10-4]|jgi:glutaredoxin|uniref:hypothetical protein n=1 Tax=Colwellia sp. BRX10-4 TaxID=2759843 RepID=UPI0015F7041D|nr:hypothetical protein [Colwellia sp. BRX10-4]MBA6397610.1 hypothetical protein [Colwellia sp. BRX10-4]